MTNAEMIRDGLVQPVAVFAEVADAWQLLSSGEPMTLDQIVRQALRPPYASTIDVSTADDPAEAIMDATAMPGWVRVRLAAGVYDLELPADADRVFVEGATGNRDDVVVTSNAETEGTWRPVNRVAAASFTLRTTTPATGTGPKYPLHPLARSQQAYTNMLFDVQNTKSRGGSSAVGMDGAGGSYMAFWGCAYRTVNPGGVTNLHGSNPQDGPLTLVHGYCDALGRAASYSTLGSGQLDNLWLIESPTFAFSASPSTLPIHTEGMPPLPAWN